MLKLLPIGLVLLATAAFIIWRLSGSSLPTFVLPKVATPSATLESEQNSLAGRIRELEFAVTDLLAKNGSETSLSQTSSFDSQIKDLQSSIDELKTRVSRLEASPVSSTTTTSTPTPTTTSKSPAYISLAASGSSSVGDWATISGTVVTIDTGDYPGYTSMQFDANIQIFQTGTAYARISNKTDGTSILSSEISTTSTSYTNVSSSKFTLPGGKKDYQLQLKSQITGYAASVQNVRIKVNF